MSGVAEQSEIYSTYQAQGMNAVHSQNQQSFSNR